MRGPVRSLVRPIIIATITQMLQRQINVNKNRQILGDNWLSDSTPELLEKLRVQVKLLFATSQTQNNSKVF